MKKNNKIPEFNNYDEMAEFWDAHSLADYWNQTEPAEFEISKDIHRRYLISVDKELLERAQNLARIRGVSTESFVNLLLEQRLHEIEEDAVNTS